jgi:hypothetical protein
MNIMTIFRSTFLSALLSIAVGQTSFAAQKEQSKAANKAESKKTKAGTQPKKAESPTKVKAEKKVTNKQETKQKTKPKNTEAKKPTKETKNAEAKKPAKEPKKLATADTFEKGDRGFPFFTLFILISGLAFVGVLCFAIWLDYRPTVYPSGKVYGPLEYLPSSFQTEISGVQKQKSTPIAAARAANAIKPTETTNKANQPVPVTVTREPVNKSVKTPPAKAG